MGQLGGKMEKGTLEHDEDLREPPVWRQGSQVSMRVARGSASWLSSHGSPCSKRNPMETKFLRLTHPVIPTITFPASQSYRFNGKCYQNKNQEMTASQMPCQ